MSEYLDLLKDCFVRAAKVSMFVAALIITLFGISLIGKAWSSEGAGLGYAPIVIEDDDGGGVNDHVKFYSRIKQAGVPVRVAGICVSACTIVLWLPQSQVCHERGSSLGFHSAARGIMPDRGLTEAMINRYYPKAVQDWISEWERTNGKVTIGKIAFLLAPDAAAIGAIRLCN